MSAKGLRLSALRAPEADIWAGLQHFCWGHKKTCTVRASYTNADQSGLSARGRSAVSEPKTFFSF
jgi:hypothetical protein